MDKASTPPPKNVDEYLRDLPADVHKALQALRETIKAAAPQSEEVISYRIPTYRYMGPLVHFAAFKDHCSFYGVSKKVLAEFEKDLRSHKIAGTTIHFTPANPLPSTLVKKIVKARIKENEAGSKSKTASKPSPAAKKSKAGKTNDADEVSAYMSGLQHPLKAEIEAVRSIIKNASTDIAERIKWNAPSYYSKSLHEAGKAKQADLVTFNCRAKNVHLVFHHPAIVKIKSALLEGDYKDRRMAYFNNMNEVKKNKKEIERIVGELVKGVRGARDGGRGARDGGEMMGWLS